MEIVDLSLMADDLRRKHGAATVIIIVADGEAAQLGFSTNESREAVKSILLNSIHSMPKDEVRPS